MESRTTVRRHEGLHWAVVCPNIPFHAHRRRHRLLRHDPGRRGLGQQAGPEGLGFPDRRPQCQPRPDHGHPGRHADRRGRHHGRLGAGRPGRHLAGHVVRHRLRRRAHHRRASRRGQAPHPGRIRPARLLRRPLRRAALGPDLGLALQHPEPARDLRRPDHGRGRHPVHLRRRLPDRRHRGRPGHHDLQRHGRHVGRGHRGLHPAGRRPDRDPAGDDHHLRQAQGRGRRGRRSWARRSSRRGCCPRRFS